MNTLKFALCLRELGIKNLNFSNRKKLANLAYLLIVFDVDIGLPSKSFRWYLHGVYNLEISELTTRLLEVADK